MEMNKQECQEVDCNNIGILVKCVISFENKPDEIHDIHMCRYHIMIQNNISRKFVN
jgi:hypothetical protein